MQGQDWTPVVIRKRQTASDLRNKDTVLQAQRRGQAVETLAKDRGREERDRLRKLEGDIHAGNEEPPKAVLPQLSTTARQLMIQSRVSKGYTQVTLANAINERVQVIQDLETGKVVSQPAVLQKVNRVLGCNLRFSS